MRLSTVLAITLLTTSASAFLPATAEAKDWYATPKDMMDSSGNPLSDTGDGSQSNPWDLCTALASSSIKAGDTLWLNAGTYHHKAVYYGSQYHRISPGVVQYVPTIFACSLQGASGNPIVVRAMPGARVILDGKLTPNSLSGTTGANYVRFQDLEVTMSGSMFDNRFAQDTGPWPGDWYLYINTTTGPGHTNDWDTQSGFTDADLSGSSTGIELINCVFHDCIGGGLGLNMVSHGTTVYGCLIYYNGWMTGGGSRYNHGHGVYTQNSSLPYKTFKNCVFSHNLCNGIQVYGSGNSGDPSDYFVLDGIMAFDNGTLGQNSTYKTTGWDLELGCPSAGNIAKYDTMVNCMTFNHGFQSATYANAWGDAIGVQNGVFTNNYFSCLPNGDQTYIAVPGTEMVGSFQNFVCYSNTFISDVIGTSTANFPNNTFLKTPPTTGTKINVYPNAYELGRANIGIMNWGRLSTVSVDISNVGLAIGQAYELHNCQDYFGDIAYGTYNGNPITVSMTGHTIAKPLGTNFATPQSTFPQFGAFVIRPAQGNVTTPPPPPANNPPTISSISSQTTTAGTAVGPITFTVGDDQTSAGSLVVTATSSNTTLVPNSAIVLGGSGANRTVTVTPAAGQSGVATITLQVSDGTLATSTSFTLTVTAPVTPPANPVNVVFGATSGTLVTPMTTGTDAATGLTYIDSTVANQGTATFTLNIPQTDTYVIWCRVLCPTYSQDSFYVSMDGAEDVYDAAEGTDSPNWQWTLVNGRNGTSTPLTLNPRTFNLARGQHQLVIRGRETSAGVTQILITNDRTFVPSGAIQTPNTPPTITSVGNQTVNANSATATLAFTVGDSETSAGILTVTASSSNTALLPNANVVLGGTGANRTVTVTPAANQIGSTTITLQVSDGTTNTSTSFTVTVVNTPPTISSVPSQIVNVGASTTAIPFTVGDQETAAASLTVTASSSNTTIVPNSAIVLGGSSANRTVTVTPATTQTGTATITLTVSDGLATTSTTFTVTVANTPPTISSISSKSIDQDTSTAAIPFTVGDKETAPASLTVTARSSNQTLVPDSAITLGGGDANRTVTIKPASGQTGSAAITLTVSDGMASASTTFTLTVNAVNTAPTISSVSDQTIDQDTSTAAIPFTVSDKETAAGSLTVTATSSNQSLVPNSAIALGGTGSSRTVTVNPASGQTGTATITLTVSDGSLTASTSFGLTMNAVNQPPTSEAQIALEAASGAIVAPMSVVTDSTNPSLKYIRSTTANQGTATYTINVTKADNYVIWCKVLCPTWASDSFFVSMDGVEDIYDAAENSQSSNWQWTQVNGRNGTAVPLKLNPRTFTLSVGQHTLVIRGREANAAIARILLTNDQSPTAPKEVLAVDDSISAFVNAPRQIDPSELLRNDTSLFNSTLKIAAVGTARNGTVTLANGSITYAPKASFLGQDSFTYTVTDAVGATSTATVNVTVQATESAHLGFEAESGVLVAPMVTVTDAQFPAREYIWSTANNQGTATYTINVPKDATYVIWCRVLCPSFKQDSFFVTVDGAQDVYDAAEGIQSTNWQWTCVNGRDGTSTPLKLNPRTFTLSAGQHTVVIQGREAYAGMDRIMVTDDLTFTPKDLIANSDTVTVAAGTTTLINPTALLANDVSLFDDALKITAVSGAQMGGAVLTNGAISYTAKAGFTGTDTFIYTVTDGLGATATATVTVKVQ